MLLRYSLAAVLILVCWYSGSGQVPNASFESWSSGNPVDWFTTNTGFTNNITQSSIAYSGSSSAKGEIVSFSGVPFIPGLTAGGVTQRVPISQNYSAVTCYFQFFPNVPTLTMSLYIAVNFFDAQSNMTAQGSLLGPFGTTSTWQQLTVPMNYSGGSGQPSTSANIQFTISGTGNPTPSDMIGSYFLLDSVGLVLPTGVREQPGEIPAEFSLEQNYPNPFNPSTNIRFQIPEGSAVKLTVHNVLGEEVATLVNEALNAGSYVADWNATGMPSGVYFYTLNTNGRVLTKKMMLTK
ncbi:MAG: T9SS type A sorting domain-containing protein [Bacteroidetes bacterium]|nr:T9SS type A sorting domain-containing protein [Bacteroidota bacterium]MCW5895464.1 T9SS type A sorting domain-containing protein [Bacteroidota bacterium]